MKPLVFDVTPLPWENETADEKEAWQV